MIGVGTNLETSAESSGSIYVDSKHQTRLLCDAHLPSELFAWIRPYWIFSLADRRPRIMRQALTASDTGALFYPQHPSRLLDFIEVRDVASAFTLIAVHRLTGNQDVGSGSLHSIRALLSCAGVRLGAGDAAFQDVAPHKAVVTRLTRLGWRPTHTTNFFRQGEGASNE